MAQRKEELDKIIKKKPKKRDHEVVNLNLFMYIVLLAMELLWTETMRKRF